MGIYFLSLKLPPSSPFKTSIFFCVWTPLLMSTSFSDGFPHAHPNTSQIDFYRRHVAVECDAASELSPPSAAASESPRRAPPSAADGPSDFLRFVRHLKWEFIFR